MNAELRHQLSTLSPEALITCIDTLIEKHQLTDYKSTLESIVFNSANSKSHNNKSANVNAKQESNIVQTAKKKNTPNAFDMSKYRQRTIALQIQYEGGPYYGFASQQNENCEETIEKHLFDALLKLRLIEDRKSCNYTRCGRTDKGVSALGQIVSFKLRSAIPKSVPDHLLPTRCDEAVMVPIDASIIADEKSPTTTTDSFSAESTFMANKNNKTKSKSAASTPTSYREHDYSILLNRVLPDNIRIIGWTPVTDDFSARFSAVSRTYRYFFVNNRTNISGSNSAGGDTDTGFNSITSASRLNIDNMQLACSYLIGKHDFRNFCKFDVANTSNFEREIYSAKIYQFMDWKDCFNTSTSNNESTHNSSNNNTSASDIEIYAFEVEGIAFLWHMVRCIMAVLLLIGQNLEPPSVINYLLALEECPSRPCYNFANELPLVLHACGFDNLKIQVSSRNLWQLHSHFRTLLEESAVKVARVTNILKTLENCSVNMSDFDEFYSELAKKCDGKHDSNVNVGVDVVVNQLKRKFADAEDTATSTSATKNTILNNSSSNNNDKNKNNKTHLSWKEATWVIQQQLLLVPQLQPNYKPYMPLAQRPKEDTFEQRLRNVSADKKEKVAQREQKRIHGAESGTSTSTFFANMRQQGSL